MKSIINSESIIIDLPTLVFGFAPKGMVVIWFRYGYVSVQLGEFQAEVIKDDKKYADKMFSTFRRREKKSGSACLGKDFKLDFKIAPDNNSMQIMIDNQPIPVDSTRIYKSDFKFKESYK